MLKGEPRCFLCGKAASAIPEYADKLPSPEEFIRNEEGTYNRYANTFACTDCYIEIGMPSTPEGWKAPGLSQRAWCNLMKESLQFLKEGSPGDEDPRIRQAAMDALESYIAELEEEGW